MNTYFNNVELRGRVGRINTIHDIPDNEDILQILIATNFIYRDKHGNAVIETTWHNVISLKKNTPDLCKGDLVSVTGRIRAAQYSKCCENCTCMEIVAKEVHKIV